MNNERVDTNAIDAVDLQYFEGLGFEEVEEGVYELLSSTAHFKLDISNAPQVLLKFHAEDSEHVLEFEDMVECREFVESNILGIPDESVESDDTDTLEQDPVIEESQEADLGTALRKAIRPKKSMQESLDDARAEAEEILRNADEKAQAILDKVQQEERDKMDELDAKAEVNAATNTLRNLIQSEGDAIEQYQSAISVISANTDNDVVVAVLNDIMEEEMVHVGQLNKVMQHIIPGFKGAYDEGEIEATKQLENAVDDVGDDEVTDDTLVDSDIDAELDDLDLDDEVETPKNTSTDVPDELDDEPLPIDVDDDDLE